MKKYIYIFAAAAFALALSSCKEEYGMEPGNDSNPVVTVYRYAPSSEYDGDNDQKVRFVSNGKVSQAYYLAEPKANKDELIKSKGESAYIEKVISEGTAISFDKEGLFETVITEMTTDYAISAVGVNGSNKSLRSTVFNGIPWDSATEVHGEYEATRPNIVNAIGGAKHEAVFQRHQTNPNMFRVKNAFGPGTKITFTLTDDQREDNGGKFTVIRIPAQVLSFSARNDNPVSVRDIGVWQGDDAYVFENGFLNKMYEDNNLVFYVQFYDASGSLGYGRDYFRPSN